MVESCQQLHFDNIPQLPMSIQFTPKVKKFLRKCDDIWTYSKDWVSQTSEHPGDGTSLAFTPLLILSQRQLTHALRTPILTSITGFIAFNLYSGALRTMSDSDKTVRDCDNRQRAIVT